MKPSLRNLFMKKLTRDRVVPIISAKACWLTLGITASGLPSWVEGRIGTCRGPLIDRVRFAADSSVEGTGFEPRACLNGCGARFLSDAKISTSANAPFYSDVYRWLAMRSGADG